MATIEVEIDRGPLWRPWRSDVQLSPPFDPALHTYDIYVPARASAVFGKTRLCMGLMYNTAAASATVEYGDAGERLENEGIGAWSPCVPLSGGSDVTVRIITAALGLSSAPASASALMVPTVYKFSVHVHTKAGGSLRLFGGGGGGGGCGYDDGSEDDGNEDTKIVIGCLIGLMAVVTEAEGKSCFCHIQKKWEPQKPE